MNGHRDLLCPQATLQRNTLSLQTAKQAAATWVRELLWHHAMLQQTTTKFWMNMASQPDLWQAAL